VLANTAATSFQQIAQDLSANLGKDIRYQLPLGEEFQAILQQVGVPEVYIGLFVTWASAVAEGMMEVEDSTLETFLGRKPTTTARFLAQVYN